MVITGRTGAGIWLYRLGLGWLLGHRFLLLTHRDCWSRQRREIVLGVVDAEPRAGVFVVAAAGDCVDWLFDVKRDPRVHVAIGADSFPAIATRRARTDTATLIELTRIDGARHRRPSGLAPRRWEGARRARPSGACPSVVVNRDVLVRRRAGASRDRAEA